MVVVFVVVLFLVVVRVYVTNAVNVIHVVVVRCRCLVRSFFSISVNSGTILGTSWANLGPSWPVFEPSRPIWGPSLLIWELQKGFLVDFGRLWALV